MSSFHRAIALQEGCDSAQGYDTSAKIFTRFGRSAKPSFSKAEHTPMYWINCVDVCMAVHNDTHNAQGRGLDSGVKALA